MMYERFFPEDLRRSDRVINGVPQPTKMPVDPPEALLITCSDCTLDIPLARRFHNEPVFVLRTIGNEVPEYFEVESDIRDLLETAVCHWQVKQITVCGHSGCSALRDEADLIPDDESKPMSRFQAMQSRIAAANRATTRAKRHALGQLCALRTYPFIENHLLDDRLHLSAMMYLHESNVLLRYDDANAVYRPLGKEF